MNYAGPVALILTLGFGCLYHIRLTIDSLWCAVIWARLALVAYYGAGSLVPLLANDDTLLLMYSFYQFFPADIAKLNLVNDVFALAFLVGIYATCSVFIAIKERSRSQDGRTFMIRPSGWDLRTIGLAFLVPGLLVSFLYIKPHAFGLIEGTQSQILAQIALLCNVGYYLMARWSLQNKSPIIYLIAFLVVVDFFFGLLQFAKVSALLPLVVFLVAYIQVRSSIIKLIVSSIMFMGIYLTITPMVSYSRNVLSQSYGSIAAASPEERFSILMTYSRDNARQVNDTEAQLGWSRLSYVNAGTFAVNQYDKGIPGSSLHNILLVFIPRFIYPNKPIITDIGRNFTIMVNGNDQSSTSPGLGAELYWNNGFFGVVAGALYVGALLCLLSIYAILVVGNGAWHLLPVVLLGMRMGIRMDGMLVPDFVGPLTVLVVGHIALTFLNNLTLKKR